MIDRYVYTGMEPLPDPDIIELINHPLKLAERGPTKKRVLEKVVDFVSTFIRGVAARRFSLVPQTPDKRYYQALTYVVPAQAQREFSFRTF